VRTVSLIVPLAQDLAAWREVSGEPGPDELVFSGRLDPHWGGGEWAAWSRDVFMPAVQACGLDIKRPHDLRHTYCTLLLHEGLPPREVARRVGETPRLVKKVYAYLIGTASSRQPIDPADFVQEIRAGLGQSVPLFPCTPL
jgi:integrase